MSEKRVFSPLQKVLTLTTLLVGLAPLTAWSAEPQVTVASITGPIPITAESGEPFRGANEQPVAGPGLPIPVLQPYGFVEEEYFVSGTVDGKPYQTSMLVRKPADPQSFSGLVAVETIHSAGAIPLWGARKVWLEGNHGWVAVASQLAALEGHVKVFNPARYESLQIPEVAVTDSASLQGAMSGGGQDDFSQAIMTQVGALLKANRDDGPFAGMTVEYLVMGGASQTGGTTMRYIQNSHEAARLPDGTNIYDGYVPQVAFTDKPLMAKGAPIVHPVTEGDIMFFGSRGGPLVIQDDSDDADGGYRHYQIAGSSHVGTRGVTDPVAVFSTLEDAMNDGEQLSQFPQAELGIPPVAMLVDWVMNGVVPPRAQRIDMADGKIVRDDYGIAKGGVRSPWVDLPTVRYIASAPVSGDNFFRGLIGLEEPFGVVQLHEMYGTRQAYLQKFNAQIDSMVADGWLFPDDGEALKAQEANRELP